MNNLASVFHHIECGSRIEFFMDFYGKQWVEIRTGLLLRRKLRVFLSDEEVAKAKDAIHKRRMSRRGPNQGRVGVLAAEPAG